MNKLEFGIVGIALLITAFLMGGLWGHHLKTEADNIAVAKQKQEQQDKIDQLKQKNVTLAAAATSTAIRVKALQQKIDTQPSKERIVYVRTKPTLQNQPPVYTAVSSDVFVTNGAVSLFNGSFGLQTSTGPTSVPDAASAELPSAFTISDYQQSTVKNAVACYTNQQQVTLLQRYIVGLQTAGWVQK